MDRFICVDAGFIDEMNINMVNDMSEPHSHDYYEIYYFTGDIMSFFMDSVPITLHTHDILLVKRHIFHKTQYISPFRKNYRANISFNSGFLYRYFDQESIDKILKLFDKPLLANDNTSDHENFIKRIFLICSAISDNDKLSLLRGYHDLCILLINFMSNQNKFQAIPSVDGLPSEQNRIAQVAKYINMNYNGNISLSSIANEFYISKFFLSHSFKETTGVSITDFINRKRTVEAANLLENTNMTLTEIFETVGFNSQPYFIKTFKLYHGISPSKYRLAKGTLREYCERISEI